MEAEHFLFAEWQSYPIQSTTQKKQHKIPACSPYILYIIFYHVSPIKIFCLDDDDDDDGETQGSIIAKKIKRTEQKVIKKGFCLMIWL